MMDSENFGELFKMLARDGYSNIRCRLLDKDGVMVEYEEKGNKLCSIVVWRDGADDVEFISDWSGWYQECKYELEKAYWKDGEKFKRICEECVKFNDGLLNEEELERRIAMFAEDVLEVSIKNLNGRNRCKVCGNRPEILYWGDKKLMLQCPECKSKVYESRVKDTDKMLHPIILDVLGQWNDDNPVVRRRRSG